MSGPKTSHGAGLLERWLQNPLDEGYAEAAARKVREAQTAGDPPDGAGSNPSEKRWGPDSLWTAVGCLLIGLVLIIAFLEANRDAPTDARTRADLRTRITGAQKQGDALERSAQNLDSRVNSVRAQALGTGSNDSLTRAQAEAGASAVRGPGVRVVLGNPPVPTAAATTGRAGTTPIGAVDDLTDTDVRAVVNELWLDGAEAVSINGIRLTPISAIRFAGQAVLVDFQPVTSPYTIDAIGNSEQLITDFTDSAVAGRYRTLSSAEGFAFSSSQVDKITMAANVLSQPRYASVAPPSPTATPTPTPTPTSSRTGASSPDSQKNTPSETPS